ncbi:hypothetical protein BH10ACT3_BH10ACT3_00470 [soil metagenome]
MTINTPLFRRALLVAAAIGAITLTACTPEQIAAVQSHFDQVRASDKFYDAVSDDGLARLRACESNGRYDVVSANGSFRGAYQFSPRTWNSVAGEHYPELKGVDPAAASPADQDRMARALWAMQGRSPWPHCGKRV